MAQGDRITTLGQEVEMLKKEIERLRKEIEELKKSKSVEIHNHYHYDNPAQPLAPYYVTPIYARPDMPYKITCDARIMEYVK